MESNQLSVKFPLKGKGGPVNWGLEVSPSLHSQLISLGKLSVRWTRNRITRCNNCYTFGHIAKNCKSAIQFCFCCGKEHSYIECKAEDTCCTNFARANKKFQLQLEEGHSCVSVNCLSYKRSWKFLKHGLLYGN